MPTSTGPVGTGGAVSCLGTPLGGQADDHPCWLPAAGKRPEPVALLRSNPSVAPVSLRVKPRPFCVCKEAPTEPAPDLFSDFISCVLVSSYCCYHKPGGLKQHVSSPPVLEVRNPMRRPGARLPVLAGGVPAGGARRSFPPLPAPAGCPRPLVRGPVLRLRSQQCRTSPIPLP